MDSLTHVFLGAAIGEALLGKRIGKTGMLLGALANSLPDIDVAANFFTDTASALIFHRGITHSFFFAGVISWLLAALFFRIYHKTISFIHWLGFFLIAIIAHDIIDVFTTYGTGLLEPFSSQRFASNSIFVIDPFYTFPLLLGFIALLVLKRNAPQRRVVNNAALLLSSLYMLFTFFNKINVERKVASRLADYKAPYTHVLTTPAPLNNFLWYVIVKNDTGYFTGYYSVFDKSPKLSLKYVPQNDHYLNDFPPSDAIEKLKLFSKGFYCITKKDSAFFFNDLRFGQVAGWARSDSRYAFSYNLLPQEKYVVVLRRTGLEISWGEALKSLVIRIKGI